MKRTLIKTLTLLSFIGLMGTFVSYRAGLFGKTDGSIQFDHNGTVISAKKTKKKLFKQIVARVEKLHRYNVPEIIAMPIIEGSDKYLSWLNKETK